MLVDLIEREIKENFNKTRVEVIIHSDSEEGSMYYEKRDTDSLTDFIESIRKDAQSKDEFTSAIQNNCDTVDIRDTTKSIEYQYNSKTDSLEQTGEESVYEPLLECDRKDDKKSEGLSIKTVLSTGLFILMMFAVSIGFLVLDHVYPMPVSFHNAANLLFGTTCIIACYLVITVARRARWS